MKQYTADRIKNIALAGHGSAGKTSLAEALLYQAGATDRLGKIEDGNTVSDFDPEEIKRKASVSTSILPIEHDGYKINIIDTPGLFDFAGGFYEGVRAAESVVIAISGKSGVAVGSEKAYKLAVEQGKSAMFFVGKLDRESADFYKVLEELKASFGPAVCPLVVPYVRNQKVLCYVDLVDMKAYEYENGKAKEIPMPEIGHRLEGLVAAISEAVAETDEALFDKYFSGEQFTPEEMHRGIANGIKSGTIAPVYCGSSLTLEGIDLMLDGMAKLLPSAKDKAGEIAVDANEEPVEIECDENAPLAAYVFKTVADPFVGKLSYFKVVSGKLSPEVAPVNARTGQPERLGKMLCVRGKKQL